jgi:hypothetical protein
MDELHRLRLPVVASTLSRSVRGSGLRYRMVSAVLSLGNWDRLSHGGAGVPCLVTAPSPCRSGGARVDRNTL